MRMNPSMKRINLTSRELVELSDGDGIERYCDNCKSNTNHTPIVQIGRGTLTNFGTERINGVEFDIEIPDIEDAYLIQCEKCGNTIIARWDHTKDPLGDQVTVDK